MRSQHGKPSQQDARGWRASHEHHSHAHRVVQHHRLALNFNDGFWIELAWLAYAVGACVEVATKPPKEQT